MLVSHYPFCFFFAKHIHTTKYFWITQWSEIRTKPLLTSYVVKLMFFLPTLCPTESLRQDGWHIAIQICVNLLMQTKTSNVMPQLSDYLNHKHFSINDPTVINLPQVKPCMCACAILKSTDKNMFTMLILFQLRFKCVTVLLLVRKSSVSLDLCCKDIDSTCHWTPVKDRWICEKTTQ